MTTLLWVSELPDDGFQRQMCRSHAAIEGNKRRVQNLVQQEIVNDQASLWPCLQGGLLPWTNPPKANDDRDGNPVAQDQRGLLTVTWQPLPPLMLDHDAAPLAFSQAHKYLHFYMNNAVSKCTLVYPAFRISSIYSTDWVRIITNRLVFHAVAAYLQAALDGQQGPSQATLMHRGKALEELRKHFHAFLVQETQVGSNVVMAISMLGLLEERLGNKQAHCMHRTIVGRILTAKGGLSNLPYEPGYSVVLETEMCWALDSGYSVLDHPPRRRYRRVESMKAPQTEQWQIETLPSGWKALLDRGALSTDVVRAVLHIAGQVNAKGRGRATENESRAELRTFDYYLDAFPYLLVDHEQDLGLEELLEMAVLQFCSHTVAPKHPGSLTHIMSRRMLTKYLPVYAAKCQTSLSDAEAKVVSWMWLLTLYAWEVPRNKLRAENAPGLQQRPNIGAELHDNIRIEEILKEFFWTQDFLAWGKERWWTLLHNDIDTD